ncbi:3'(2'),5'-bisphosphate nucleotidase CysQ [bacterium]|nr:3'(2'),5'-bisphosphate nucleotidase CysQ [bacterium]
MFPRSLEIARMAGDLILAHYQKETSVSLKSDGSPVTAADQESSDLIARELAFTGFPVLSEEAEVEYSIRKNWTTFWLVDPLDGTKEYINRTGEFTVNIALIENGLPVFGIVHAPALELLAWAERGKGAFLETAEGTRRLDCRKTDSRVGVHSRTHRSKQCVEFFQRNGMERDETVGSALKFVRIAEGKAGLYARFVGSKEWDTAAGQILLQEAGGWILRHASKTAPTYNKEDLENGDFIAGSGTLDPRSLDW